MSQITFSDPASGSNNGPVGLPATENQAKLVGSFGTSTDGSQTGALKVFACDYSGTDKEVIRVSTDGTHGKLSFFGNATVAQQTGGAATASGTYGSTEQTMLQAVYDALRNYGLLT